MTEIIKTLLATQDPATVAETQRAIPYTDDSSNPDNAAFSTALPLDYKTFPLAGVFMVKADWEFILEGGFGKTCWGARMDVAGEVDENDPTSAYLTITNDDFVAGKILGVDLTFTFGLKAWKIHHHFFSHSWDVIFDETIGPYRFDLLTILYNIVAVALNLFDEIPFADIIAALLPQNVGVSGYFDKQSGIVESGNSLTVTPQVVGDIDLVNLAVCCGVDIISTVFLVFPPAEVPVQAATRLGELGIKALSFVTPSIAFGPSFGFGSPVNISITDFTVSDATYTVTGVDHSTSPPRLKGQGSSAPNTPLSDMMIDFKAADKDAVLVGVFAQITWLKVISKEARKVWDVYDLAGITAFNDPPITTTFSNNIGAMNLVNSDIF